jgi:glutaconate CoA-transferase subunit A
MKNKLMKLDAAVKTFVKDRMSIAAGGFPLARQSNIFAKEILRQNKAGGIKVHDLFWIEPGIGFGASMMVAEGIVDSIVSTFSSHERAGLSVIARDALEKGIPRKLKWEDESNLSLNSRLMAGALNLPFMPCGSGIWGDLKKPGLWDGRLPYLKNVVVDDPYGSGRKIALLQALSPDLSVVHVPFADTHGNGIILGSMYYDFWLARAGKKIVLIADQIVDTEMCRRYPNLVTVPGVGVDAVIPWFMGAWPTNSPGLYGEDLEHVTYFVKNSRGEALRNYLDKYVYSWKDHAEYLALIGPEKVAALRDNPANVLSEPFRQWILPQEEVCKLTPVPN